MQKRSNGSSTKAGGPRGTLSLEKTSVATARTRASVLYIFTLVTRPAWCSKLGPAVRNSLKGGRGVEEREGEREMENGGTPPRRTGLAAEGTLVLSDPSAAFSLSAFGRREGKDAFPCLPACLLLSQKLIRSTYYLNCFAFNSRQGTFLNAKCVT